MNEPFIKNIRVLKKAIAERKLVVFAGSGISIDSEAPSWEELIKELTEEITIPENETDFLRIAQMYYNERQQKELVDKIRNVLKYKKLRYNPLHESIFELDPEHVLTTNFDDLLEQVIRAKAYPFSVIKKDAEFPYGNNTKLLVKIHGDLDEANFVIKEDDYLEYSNNHPLIEGFIKGVFANKIILFIGYGFSDINLKIILQSVRNILGQDFQNAYMLSTEENFHSAKRQYLKNKGINLINYDDAGYFSEVNSIEQYLFVGKNALNHAFYKKNTALSKQGIKLLNLIRFITKYNDFAESLAKEDPLTQIYKSLNRFSEVPALPPSFLGNLFPFNSQKNYIDNYYDSTIGSNNKTITNFFFEEFDNEQNVLRENYYTKYSISINRREDLQKRLNYVLTKMNYASILFFGRSKNKIGYFESAHQLTEKIKISLPAQECDCLNCLFNDLKINEFLKKLKEGSITETSAIQEDLLLAYSNHKAGNFKTSYIQFEEIANKSWQLGKYASYYIAKQNVKHLRNMIKWVDDDTSDENKRLILDKIDDLDLDKLLFQIPNLDDDEYKLLKIIRDDDILKETENEINNYYEKVNFLYQQYNKGGFSSSGPFYPKLIADELNKLFIFYTYNFIVKDEYLQFKRVVQKGIKSLIICFSINENYQQRLKTFNFWMMKLVILYSKDDDLLNIWNVYKITHLDLDEKDVNDAINYLNNLLKSLFKEENFLGRRVSLDENLLIQTKNSFFQDRVRNIIHNALLIFSGIKIPETYGKGIVRNFLDFLKTEDILFWNSEKYLNKFLLSTKDHFLFEDFIELLTIFKENDSPYSNRYFFNIIGFGLKEKYPEKEIDSDSLVKDIINKCLNLKRSDPHLGFMFLWKVSNSMNKELIEKALKLELSTNFDVYAYLDACFEGIFHPSNFYNNLVKELERNIPKDIVWEDGQPHHKNLTFFNFINMLYAKNLQDEKIPFTKFDEYPAFWKFYLEPSNFDYSKFDPKWLLIFKGGHVHNKLSRIGEIGLALKDHLKSEFQNELGKIYVEFYL